MHKATNTHSEYVLLIIAFSLQQWLRERASMLLYTYIACLVAVKKIVDVGKKMCMTSEWLMQNVQSLFYI
jgi:hypothetical protein